MDQGRINRIAKKDPREKKNKSPQEIIQQWRDKKLGGVVFIWPAFGALIYLIYWFSTQAKGFHHSDPLPMHICWAFGLVLFGTLGWFIYGMNGGYACPNCGSFVGMDWSLGTKLFSRGKSKRPQEYCNNCDTKLEWMD